MITTQNQFVGELNIILQENCGVDNTLKYFIDKYEPEILRKVVGQKFYNDILAALEVEPLDAEFDKLINGGSFDIDGVAYHFRGLKWITAGIIYYWYHRNNAYNTAQTGGTKPTYTSGLESVSMGFKMRQAFNEAIDLIDDGKCNTPTLKNFLENSDFENYEVCLYENKIMGLQWL
jgi:hypothetical protein